MPANAIARRFASGVPDDKACAIEALEPRLLLSGGQFDPTFGTEVNYQGAHLAGGATYGELFPEGIASAIALQPDGKIIEGGTSAPGDGIFGLARYQPNGSLDRTFGTAGRATLDFGVNSGITALAIQRDGKIVAAGFTNDQSSGGYLDSFAVARFLPSGRPDPGFGSGGKVTVQFLGFDIPNSVAIEPDGSIVAAGSASYFLGGETQFALARFTPRGTLDRTFGSGGKVLTPFPPSSAAGAMLIRPDGKMLIQPDGKIVESGEFGEADGTYSLVLVRYRANGSLDPQFGDGGRVVVRSVGSPNTEAVPVTLQPDGKIIAVAQGPVDQSGFADMRVLRFTPRGTLDSHFGSGGKADVPRTDDGAPSSVLVQPDGRIVVVGQYFLSNIILARLMPCGAPDTSFGDHGVTDTPLVNNGRQLTVAGAALRTDGRIVVAASTIPAAEWDFALARYTPSGRLDDSFGFHGTAQQENGLTGSVGAIAVQRDGRIVVAGSELSPNPGAIFDAKPTEAALARYQANGMLDTSFGVDGRMLLRDGDSARFNAMAIDAAGDIVVAGVGQRGGINVGLVARYLPNGMIDRTFGSGGEVLTSFGDPHGQQFNALAIQRDGNIVVAGSTSNRMAVARYLPTGAPDPHFGSSGKELLRPGTGDSQANGMALQSDGKIVLAGSIGDDFGVVRLKTNGALDPTFAEHGMADTPIPNIDQISTIVAAAKAIAIDWQGRIVVGGNFTLARYLPTGRLDPAFGSGGLFVVAQAIYDDPPFQIDSLVLDGRGGVIVGGVEGELGSIDPPSAPFVERITPAGLDNNFGYGGMVNIDGGATPSVVLALQPDGKILAADTDLFRLTAV